MDNINFDRINELPTPDQVIIYEKDIEGPELLDLLHKIFGNSEKFGFEIKLQKKQMLIKPSPIDRDNEAIQMYSISKEGVSCSLDSINNVYLRPDGFFHIDIYPPNMHFKLIRLKTSQGDQFIALSSADVLDREKGRIVFVIEVNPPEPVKLLKLLEESRYESQNEEQLQLILLKKVYELAIKEADNQDLRGRERRLFIDTRVRKLIRYVYALAGIKIDNDNSVFLSIFDSLFQRVGIAGLFERNNSIYRHKRKVDQVQLSEYSTINVNTDEYIPDTEEGRNLLKDYYKLKQKLEAKYGEFLASTIHFNVLIGPFRVGDVQNDRKNKYIPDYHVLALISLLLIDNKDEFIKMLYVRYVERQGKFNITLNNQLTGKKVIDIPKTIMTYSAFRLRYKGQIQILVSLWQEFQESLGNTHSDMSLKNGISEPDVNYKEEDPIDLNTLIRGSNSHLEG